MQGTNLLVFRDSKRKSSLKELCAALILLLDASTDGQRGASLDALIAAGQMESALADSHSEHTTAAESITDRLAAVCINPSTAGLNSLRNSLERLAAESENPLQVSDPEGFCFYSLHPLDYADAMTSFRHHDQVAVIGVRSIGTTLSAVAVAALNASGGRASRITVRPTGHPYDRCTEFTAGQELWIREQVNDNAQFVIVDEGPGLSGSSFLSVAESLVRQRVPSSNITMIGTRDADPDKLCARKAPERWLRYKSHTASSRMAAQHSDLRSLGGGAWREIFLPRTVEWPACWAEMESSKFISRDSKNFFKFEGLGPAGAAMRRRAVALSDAQFGPLYEASKEGVSRYRVVAGRPLHITDLSGEIIDQIADYCSFRAKRFHAANEPTDLKQMLAFNYSQETGGELDLRKINLTCEQAAIPDGRMQPHKWLWSEDGKRFLKADGTRHGDDHFFPGPTDILWDLGGTAVEWNMTQDAADYLTQRLEQHGYRRVSSRLPSFVLAYSCFRMGYCKMAMSSVENPQEQSRFESAYKFYRRKMVDTAAQIDERSS